MFRNIKTFKMEELLGRTILIESFSGEEVDLLVAIDIHSGELFVLKEYFKPKGVQSA